MMAKFLNMMSTAQSKKKKINKLDFVKINKVWS